MVKVYYICLMEFNQNQIDDKNGPKIVRAIADLQAVTGTAGESNLYQVNNEQAFLIFKSEIKRLNP
jgi:hypothetical protein